MAEAMTEVRLEARRQGFRTALRVATYTGLALGVWCGAVALASSKDAIFGLLASVPMLWFSFRFWNMRWGLRRGEPAERISIQTSLLTFVGLYVTVLLARLGALHVAPFMMGWTVVSATAALAGRRAEPGLSALRRPRRIVAALLRAAALLGLAGLALRIDAMFWLLLMLVLAGLWSLADRVERRRSPARPEPETPLAENARR
jgi:hypothetical protein